MKAARIVLILSFIAVTGVLVVHSQMGILAPTEAMDTLSEGSVGPSTSVLDRLQGDQPAPSRGPSYAEDDYYYEEAETYRSDRSYLQQEATPTPELVRILAGQRIYCAVCGELLEDVFYATELKSLIVGQEVFKDNGEPPDENAGDMIFTHKDVGKVRSDVIGPNCLAQRRHLFRMLEVSTEMNHMDFYGLYVTTDDEFSKLYRDKIENEFSFREIDKVEKVLEWLTDRPVIKNFRMLGQRDDVTAPLIPLFIPRPPYIPIHEVPEGLSSITTEGRPGYKEDYYGDDYYY